VVNISKFHTPQKVDPRRFESDVEGKLFEAYRTTGQKATEKIAQKDYPAALKVLSSLRQPVDEFFEGVMVMAEDEKIKNNRLSLLSSISQLFFKIGDFSKISTS